VTSSSAAPVAESAPADLGAATPTPAAASPAPDAAAPAPARATNADGIDDENWLPGPGAARDAFQAATDVMRVDPAAAVGRFVDAAGKAKGFYAAWFNAGAAAEAAGDVGAAERHYRTALTVRPDYGPALANLATLLQRSGRAAEGKRLTDEALRKFPDKAGPHVAAATLAWTQKDLATAEREALAALRIDERSVPSMRVMAAAFRAQGRLDTAKFALENALAVEPGNALLLLELGHVLLDQQDEKGAIVAYEKAARLRPELVEAQESYGVLLLKQGFANEAVRAFESAVRLQPKSARAQLHYGNGLRAIKAYDRAEKAYKEALRLDATLKDAHFNLGVLYVDNPLPGIEELARWQKALVELRAYKDSAKPTGPLLARVDEYIDATDKRILREIKRREREERRKKEAEAEAKAGAAAQPAPAAAAGIGGADAKK
jgi:tetratricopeptide (TPR) repeat protein